MVNGCGSRHATMDSSSRRAASPRTSSTSAAAPRPSRWNAFGSCRPRASGRVFINVFGGIPAAWTGGRGRHRRREEAGPHAGRWSCARGHTSSRARRCLADSGLALTMADDMADGANKAVALAKGQKPYGHPRRQITRVVVQGSPQRGRLPRRALQGVGHHGCRRRHAGQGRHHPRGLCRLEHGGRGRRQRGRELRPDLRAAPAAPTPSWKPPPRASRSSSASPRGFPSPTWCAPSTSASTKSRSSGQLPGGDHARPGQGRHHAGHIHTPGEVGVLSAQRHADL